MIAKLFPILLALLGLGAGVGGGIALRPEPEPVSMDNPCGDPHETDTHEPVENGEDPDTGGFDYVKLNNQFVVPIVEAGRVSALVVMSLNLEVGAGQTEEIYQLEPKIRDGLLQVMFDHANAGGFSGDFTKAARMNVLRTALKEAAQKMLGPTVSDVLIIDVVRQDA